MNKKSLHPCLLVLLLSCGLCLAEEGELYMPDDKQRAQILAGQVLSVPIRTSKYGATVWGAIRINAPAQAIFDSIVYCNGETSAHRTMRRCTVMETGDTYEIVEHRIKYHWYIPMQSYIYRGDYTGNTSVRFRVLEGDLKKLDGGWDLFPVEEGNGYLVRYYATIQPRIPAPRWLVRRSLKKEIPEMLQVMKNISENPNGLAELDAAEQRRLAEKAKKKVKRR